MQREYHPLPLRPLGNGAGLRRPTQQLVARVALESPALDAMTDLARVAVAAIRPEAPLDAAKRVMIARGVRLLLVVDGERDLVLGAIAAADILGERPLQVATARGVRREELAVADVMTPAAQVEVLDLEQVRSARVGHVLETLRASGRQHALVVDDESMVRGIFSLSQIARQLGIALVSSGETALTFSQIEAALVR